MIISEEEFVARHINYELVSSDDQLQAMIEQLRAINPSNISVDLETTSLSPVQGAIRLMQIGVLVPGLEKQWLVDQFAVDLSPLQKLMETPRVIKNIQFSPFEYGWFFAHYGWRIQGVLDSFAMMHTIRGLDKDKIKVAGNSLKSQAEFAGVKIEKAMGEFPWDEELGEDQLRYAAIDVAVIPYIHQKLLPILAAHPRSFETVYNIQNHRISETFAEHQLSIADQKDMHNSVEVFLNSNKGLPTSNEQEKEQLSTFLRKQPLTKNNRQKLFEQFTK